MVTTTKNETNVSLTQHEEYRVEHEKLIALQQEKSAVHDRRVKLSNQYSRQRDRTHAEVEGVAARAEHRRSVLDRFFKGDKAALDEPEPELPEQPDEFVLLDRRDALLTELIAEQEVVVRHLRTPAGELVCSSIEREYRAKGERLASALVEAALAANEYEQLLSRLEVQQVPYGRFLPGSAHLHDPELLRAMKPGAISGVKNWIRQAMQAGLVNSRAVPDEMKSR